MSRALSESSEVDRTIQRAREEGWSLYLIVDRKTRGSLPETYEVTAASEGGEALFRVDSEDVSFLRSIGIDPTRTLRRRRA